MKQPILTAGLLALGMNLVTPALAESAMQEQIRERGEPLDLTGFLQAKTDASSGRLLFGASEEHAFTVEEGGDFLIESEVMPGYATDYRITAVLRDAQGREIARQQAMGARGGLSMRQTLEPGDYVLEVEAQRFGTRGKPGDGYMIEVQGVDAAGKRRKGAVHEESGAVAASEGSDSAFVRGADDVATLSRTAPTSVADSPSDASSGEMTEQQRTGGAASTQLQKAEPAQQDETSRADRNSAEKASTGFETLVTSVKIRARGEVMTFEMPERGTVAITTATYPPGYEDTYRIELEVVDEKGRVMAADTGEGFDGNAELATELAPGRYRIRVEGQKFGSVMTGINQYELRVELKDRK